MADTLAALAECARMWVGHTLGPSFGFQPVPGAGVVPTRDDLVAWYAGLSFADWWRSVDMAIHSLPYAARLTTGLVLSAIGIYLLVRSYKRVMRPTQGALARRVAQAAQDRAGENVAVVDRHPGLAPVSLVRAIADGIENPAAPKPAEIAPPAPPDQRRRLSAQAFLTADEFSEGPAPWAVPLGHDLVRIGRHQENDVRLDDKTVHRYHALLQRSSDGDFFIRDLSGQAGNGVYVNGARIELTALRTGDLVELGAVRLRFQQQRPS